MQRHFAHNLCSEQRLVLVSAFGGEHFYFLGHLILPRRTNLFRRTRNRLGMQVIHSYRVKIRSRQKRCWMLIDMWDWTRLFESVGNWDRKHKPYMLKIVTYGSLQWLHRISIGNILPAQRMQLNPTTTHSHWTNTTVLLFACMRICKSHVMFS